LESSDGGTKNVSLLRDLILLSLDTVDFGGNSVLLSAESDLVGIESVDGIEK
jgi:hypothetical protein